LELKAANDKLNKANKKLQEAADHDFLTGLYNRRFLFNFLEKELHRVERYGENLSIMMFDVDYFKAINDTYGHNNGDLVLKAMCAKATEVKRSTDLLARYGGEEFLLLMQCHTPEEAVAPMERIVHAVRNAPVPIPHGEPLAMTVTMGLARAGDDEAMGSVIERADRALYRGKTAGRDCYVFADD